MAQSLLTRIKANARNRDANAAATLALIAECFIDYRSSGDWTNLAWIISVAHGSDRKRIAAIIEAASNVTFRADVKQPTGLRIANKGAENNRLDVLMQYVAAGVSFRSKSLEDDEGIPALLEGKEPKKRTVEEIVQAAVRKARKDCPEQATDVRIMEALRIALAAD